MVFVRPGLLVLLILVLPLAAMHFGRRAAMSPGRAAAVAAIRALAFALLVLALARPVIERPDSTQTVVAVADLSASLSAADIEATQSSLEKIVRQKAANERIRLVVFDGTARTADLAAATKGAGALASLRAGGRSGEAGSALADAIELAGAMIPHDGRGRVLAFTDGLETRGDARAAAHRLAERGIAVEVVPVGTPGDREVILQAAAAPATGGIGATITVAATVESAREADARLVVRPLDGGAETATPARLRAGVQTIACACPLRGEGITRLSVRIECVEDTLADNNDLPVAVHVDPPRRVLVVEDDDAAPAAAALRQFLGEAATVSAALPAALATANALENADLLVIADTPAEAISPDVQARIRDAVTGGLGLLVAGGRRAFGPGGYANTPLADVLPVRSPQKLERRDPSTTLVVIIDTSGSMGGPRVNLAKEIARLAISRLKPHDKAGIVEFYGSKRWAAPIQPASNAIDLQRALNRLSSSGGTVILPAIEEAYYALQNVRTRTKHVLVLTDGGVETGAFEPLIRRMADTGITLSTVMVGPGSDSAFLASLAQWGRGRFYSAPDRFNLPEVIVKQPESSLLSPFVEQPSALRATKDDPIAGEIDFATAPPVGGYVETEARPTADVVLTTAAGHPLLARWRFGLGMAAAYTSQIGGDWSADLAKWPAYGKLFANLVRSLAAVRADEALRIRPVQRPGAVELQIENRAARHGPCTSAVEVTVSEATAGPAASQPNGGAVLRRQTLDPIRPDEWNALLTDLPAGTYRVGARALRGRLAGSAAFAVPPVREVTALGPDRSLVADVNGLHERAARRARELSATPARTAREVWPGLVVASIAMILLNVLVRRWPGRPLRPVGALSVAVLSFAMLAVAGPAARAATTAPASQPASQPAAIDQALLEGDASAARVRFGEACRAVLARDGSLGEIIAYLSPRAGESPRAAWLLAIAQRESGELAEARKTLAAATGGADAGTELWTELAQVEELLGNDAGALAALEKAEALERDPARLFALRIRSAMIRYDGNDRAAAGRLLLSVAAERPEAADYCMHLAGLAGDNETAVALLSRSGDAPERLSDNLFHGLFLLRLNRPDAAAIEFEQAYGRARLDRDRRFALERLITATRRANRLPALVDRWLGDEQLSADRLTALVSLLRELGRAADALRLLQRPPRTPEQRQWIESPEIQRELITVAVEAGREADAEAAYRTLIEREPQRADWRIGLARLKLLQGQRDEGLRLFQDALEGSDDPRVLMGIAAGARQLTLNDVALAAARKAGTKGPAAQVRAGLFEADVLRQGGQTDRAIALLKRLVATVQDDPALLPPVADALERYGDKVEALRLYQRLYEKNRGEDTLLRIAWLMEENQRFDDAYALWKEMWQTTQVAARLRQAQDHMLGLASRTGRLADLAIELEEQAAEGKGGERTLSMLIEIYTRANDPVSAAEILQDLGRLSGDRVETLKRLVKVYLNCEQFGRCNTILRQLARIDPANAADYLQQIAIVALERKQPQQAKAALAELSAAAGADPTTDEFAAGVLDMSGLHREAAEAYARVLARNPDRVEVFLLWGNAMKAAGRTDQAVARLQSLVEAAEEDDLFTVAIDGLLNLGARPPVLRSALRRVYCRIAAGPGKVFLYQLACDLLEAIGQMRRMSDVMEQAVVVAGERRGPMLRELMESARDEGRNDRVIEFGRSLLSLGEEMPPQVFLDLGEAMIKEGDWALAERVFDRAAAEGDYSMIRQRVAGYYENANMVPRAYRIIRELLVSEPENVALLIRAGGLCEQLGDFAGAFDQYYRAADLMLRRLPGVVQTDDSAAREPAEVTGRRPQRVWRAANLDEMGQFFESAGNGLRSAARTPELRQRLLADLAKRMEEEMGSLANARAFAPALDRNPRLDRLARFVRTVAFSLHEPELADRVDRRLLDRYPQDRKLAREVVRARQDWGLHARADAIGEARSATRPAAVAATRSGDAASSAPAAGTTTRPAPAATTRRAAPGVRPLIVRAGDDAWLRTLLSDPAMLRQSLDDGSLNAAGASRLVPLLLLSGRDTEAREVLRATAPDPTADVNATATLMVATAAALEDREAARTWTHAWLDASRKAKDASQMAATIEKCIRLAWNHLAPEDRAGLVDRVGQLAAGLEDDKRLALDLLRMRLAERLGMPFDDLDRVMAAACKDKGTASSVLGDLLEKAPPAARPDLLRRMVAAREPAARRSLLMALAGRMTSPPDESLAAAFEELFKAAPRQRLDPERGYWQAQESNWNRNRRQPEIGRRLGEVLLSESPGEIPVLIAVAGARSTAGLHDAAMPLIREAVEGLLGQSKPDFELPRMLADLARLIRPADVRALVADLDERLQIEGASAVILLTKGILLESLDESEAAVEAYRAALALSPTERTLIRRLIQSLKETGRTVELSRLLASTLTRATLTEAFEWRTLQSLYCEHYDWSNALRAVAKDETPLAAIEAMRVLRMMGRVDDVRTTFRRFYIRNRDTGRFFSPFWPAAPSPGGVVGALERLRTPFWQRERIFAALADLPFAEEEYTALLLAAPPEQGDVQGLIDGLAKAMQLRNTRATAYTQMAEAHRRDALNIKDRRLLATLAAENPAGVPAGLVPAIDDIARYADPADTALLGSVARFYRLRGETEKARHVLVWLLVNDLQEGHGSRRIGERFEHIDEYLATLPEDRRRDAHRRLLDRLGPGPLDTIIDEFDANILERWASVGEPAEIDRRIATYRKHLDTDSSAGACRSLLAAIARCEAAAGRFEGFAATVGRLIDSLREDLYGSQPFDCRRVLPPVGRLDDAPRYVEAVAAAIEARRAAGAISRALATQCLCFLVDWCADNGLLEPARAILTRAEAIAGGTGGHWLWIADGARRVNAAAKAVEIELRLLEADMLPVLRVPALLDAIEAARGQEAADRLAARVAGYSDHPQVLKRAIREARRAGEAATADALAERLRKTSPG